MKIIIVGASGTMGTYLAEALEKEHEVIRADRKGKDVTVDITAPETIEKMYQQTGVFDALICTAGPTWVGPWKNLNNDTFRSGMEGKMMGQINLVLIGSVSRLIPTTKFSTNSPRITASSANLS